MSVGAKPVSVFAGWMSLFSKPERVGSKLESVSAGWMSVGPKPEQVSAGCVWVCVKRMSVFAGRARVGAKRAWLFPGPRSVPAEAVSPVRVASLSSTRNGGEGAGLALAWNVPSFRHDYGYAPEYWKSW